MFGVRSFVVLFGCIVAGFVAAFAVEKPASSATTLPAGFTETRVAEGLVKPTTMACRTGGYSSPSRRARSGW